MDSAVVYRAAILLSYYGFFRISNLVPPIQHSFDVHRQLTREDVSLLTDCVRVHLKWAKNLQKADQSHDVYLPRMDSAWLCPHATLSQLFSSQFYSPKDPVIKNNGLPLIKSQLRSRFALVLKMLQLPVASLTFHSLRRSEASVAFNNNVSFEGIRAHGAWQSDANLSCYKVV